MWSSQGFPQALHPVALPLELVDALNQTYFLHLLANEPDKVIPPGKSLLSMLAHSHIAGDKPESTARMEDLEDRIKEAAHKAFWDEAFETLSSPEPSVQLKRLRVLYNDLKDTLAPLFPLNHPTMQTLSSPLAPTTSPLHSAASLLKEVLVAVKQRCAPARDQAVNELLHLLTEIPTHSALTDPSSLHKRREAVVNVILKVIQSTLTFSEVMKEDVNQFVLGAMSEAQIESVVRQQAKARERELVLKLWSAPGTSGQHVIRERWHSWVEQVDTDATLDGGQMKGKWKLRLLQALQHTASVSCVVIPSKSFASAAGPAVNGDHLSTSPNALPPQFLFTVPKLVSVQNYMQALVITAALRSLFRVPAHSNIFASPPVATATNFSQRVWTILAGEIEATQAVHRPDDIEETKITHLVDELIMARRAITELGVEEEQHLRAAADNLLRPEDPVYLLLHRRLVTVLRERLFASPVDIDNRNLIPEKMKTGKDMPHDRAGKRLRLDVNRATSSESVLMGRTRTGMSVPTPKGFEDPVLALEVNRLFSRLLSCVVWVEEVWGDLV
ncbi:hypothetical protein JOM56_002189 [Amanita muscaria]